MGSLAAIGAWLVDRLALGPLVAFVREHKNPPELSTWRGWLYVTGLTTLSLFVNQVITGMALTSKYVPSPEHAYASLVHITDETAWGSAVRALHFFGASGMVVLVVLHASRVFLTGSYKYPRQMNWVSGVVLLLLTLAMAWTGQLLRWNQDGLWTVVVHARMAERVPWFGHWFAAFLLGGEHVGGPTLTRFYTLHVVLFPAIIAAMVAFHIYLLVQNGVSELPKAGRPVDPSTYRAWYRAMKERAGRHYVPYVMWREVVFAAVTLCVVAALSWLLGPRPVGLPPDAARLDGDPKPDWFVLWYYALLWVKPRGAEALVMVWLPLAAIVALFALPFVRPAGERAPSRRPWAVAAVAAGLIAFAWLLALGIRAPWVPASDVTPLGAAALGTDDPDALAGARTFAVRGCQSCHAVRGEGGGYGPDLTDVTARMSDPEITSRVLRGVRDMPAYQGIVSAEELDAILVFLHAAREGSR